MPNRFRTIAAATALVAFGLLALAGQGLHLVPGSGHNCGDPACRDNGSTSGDTSTCGDGCPKATDAEPASPPAHGGPQHRAPTCCHGCQRHGCQAREGQRQDRQGHAAHARRQQAPPARRVGPASPGDAAHPVSADGLDGEQTLPDVSSRVRLHDGRACPICQFFATAKPMAIAAASITLSQTVTPACLTDCPAPPISATAVYHSRAPPQG